MKRGFKIFATYLLAGLVPIIALGLSQYWLASSANNREVREKLSAYENIVNMQLAQKTDHMSSLGRQMASEGSLTTLLAQGDSPDLQAKVRRLRDNSPGLDFVTVTDAQGLVVARAHSDQVGDSLANAAGYSTALKGQPELGRLDKGSEGRLTVESFFPVLDNNKQVGVVAVGFALASDDFVDRLKDMLQVESTIFEGDTRAATTIVVNGQRAVNTKMTNPDVLRDVLQNGQNFNAKNVILGQNYDTAYWPIKNQSGEVKGMFFIGLPSEVYQAKQRKILLINAIFVLGTIVYVTILGWRMAGNISRPIYQAIETLSGSITSVADNSSDLLNSCRILAETSAKQATEIAHSSEMLEQVAGQSHKSAQRAAEAGQLMDKTRHSAEEASVAMEGMMAAISDIRKSSDLVSGIIKTIEEIAFQTKLLALNAAVEAARAGEHGQGFSVVAGEVGNLAARAASAAGETTLLIGQSVKSSNDGQTAAAQASVILNSTFEEIHQAYLLIKDVGANSSEQSANISQINEAISSMSGEVEEVAAIARQTTAVVTELSSQSHLMNEAMGDLTKMVGQEPSSSPTGRGRPRGPKGVSPLKLEQ